MRGRPRLGSALALTTLAALGVAERAALHRHPIDENDLVPHELALVRSGAACGGGPHIDSSVLSDHPVCVECTLAASAIAVAPSEMAQLAGRSARALLTGPPAAVELSARPRVAGARGPPPA